MRFDEVLRQCILVPLIRCKNLIENIVSSTRVVILDFLKSP
jgi:hypothetical protein